MVLVFVPVRFKLRSVAVEFKVRSNLIMAVFQICVIREVVSAAHFDGTHTLDFGGDTVHYPYRVDIPNYGRLPVHRHENALYRLVCRYLESTFLAAELVHGICYQSVVGSEHELNCVAHNRQALKVSFVVLHDFSPFFIL